MFARRTVRVVALALAFGIAAGVVKGASSHGVVWQVRSQVANLSAPWLLVAWAAGSRTKRIGLAAVLGLVATAVALAGFYLVCGFVEPMGGRTVVDNVRIWISANRVYFEAGLISGPVFGALGGWWARRRSPNAPIVAGALLIGEPLVLALTGAVFPNGVLGPGVGLPLVIRVVPGFGVHDLDPVWLGVHGVEIALGVASLVVGIRLRRRRGGAREAALPA